MLPLSLWGSVGPDLENDPDDVRSVATNLWSLGYAGSREAAETGEWNDALETNVREYQRANGLTIDGLARPGGETEHSLNGNSWGGNSSNTAPQFSARDEGNDLPQGFGEAHDSAEAGFRNVAQRPNPFAVARARSKREDSLIADMEAMDSKQSDPAAALLGNNSITGKPIQLGTIEQPLVSPSSAFERRAGAGVIAKLAEIATRHAQVQAPQLPLTMEEREQILAARGLRYRPDPMGRVGQGDWIDASGRVVGEDEKARSLVEASRLQVPTRQSDELAPSLVEYDARPARRGHNALGDWLRQDGRSEEQIENILSSDIARACTGASLARRVSGPWPRFASGGHGRSGFRQERSEEQRFHESAVQLRGRCRADGGGFPPHLGVAQPGHRAAGGGKAQFASANRRDDSRPSRGAQEARPQRVRTVEYRHEPRAATGHAQQDQRHVPLFAAGSCRSRNISDRRRAGRKPRRPALPTRQQGLRCR